MANTNNDYNLVENLGLRCFEQKVTDKAVILKTTFNKKDKETGEYTKPTYIDVICPLGKCDIEEDDYAKSFINVWGQLSAGEFKTKSGDVLPTLSIFATKVTKREN